LARDRYYRRVNDLLIIFLAQIVYVSLVTVRWIILVKGARFMASFLSFFEILIYAYCLTLVVSKLDDPVRLVVYAAGYAIGCLVGTWVEARLAYGTAAVQCILPCDSGLTRQLRELGFAGTEWHASGRDAGRRLLLVILKRKQLAKLLALVNQLEPAAVVMELEPRSLRGGVLPKAA